MSGTAGDRRAAADLLARFEREPELRARAERAYRGRHDLQDALWWAAHPGAAAPSGTPDPAVELRRLRSAAFSRAGQESEEVEVPLPSGGIGRIRRAEAVALECEAQLERDRADLGAALAVVAAGASGSGDAVEDAARRNVARNGVRGEGEAPGEHGGFGVSMGSGAADAPGRGIRPARRFRPARRAGQGSRYSVPAGADGTGVGPEGDPATADTAAPDGVSVPGRRGPVVPQPVSALRSVLLRRPVTTTAVLALVGVLAGAGITWAALSGAGRPSVGMPPASGILTDAPSWDTPAQGSPPALEVFNREPRAEDTLPAEFFLDAPAATARLLYTKGSLKVWGFLERGQVCMFVQEGEAASGTCVARDSFGYAGVTLMLSAEGTLMPDPTFGIPGPPITDLTWTPQGQIQIRSAPLGQDSVR